MLFLETKWASLIPYGVVAKLLEDVLPTDDALNAVTIRNHVLRTAERMEANLGEEKPRLFEEAEQDGEAQPTPDGPMTVGIDGGFVRAPHKQGWFEVIAGKSVVAFRRDDDQQKESSKCFSFVQTQALSRLEGLILDLNFSHARWSYWRGLDHVSAGC